MSKSKNKVRIRFVGNNAEDVTGSCTVVEYNNYDSSLLLECGLIQDGHTTLQNYQLNTKKFNFKPKELSYVIIGHLHTDHIGLIPRLYAEGCTAKLIIPKGSKEILKAMLEDSAHIMERDSEDLIEQTGKNYPPIYTIDDVNLTLSYVMEVEINEKTVIDDYITLKYVPAGHIIFSCQILLWAKSGTQVRSIAYTSDLGNKEIETPYCGKFEPIEKANILIGETTYANKNRQIKPKDREKDLEKLKSCITQYCLNNKGRCVIPCFSLSRTQVILTYLYDIFKDDDNFNIPVILDSVLGLRITKLYQDLLSGEEKDKFGKVLEWDRIKFFETFEETEAFVGTGKSCIFISSSGMLTAGRAVWTVSKLLPNKNDLIVFVGFSVENTLARKIKEGKTETVSIGGKPIRSRAQIIDLKSFSSHAQRDQLLWYYSSFNFERIALVHGEMESKIEFSHILEEELRKKNKTSKVSCCNKGTEICI